MNEYWPNAIIQNKSTKNIERLFSGNAYTDRQAAIECLWKWEVRYASTHKFIISWIDVYRGFRKVRMIHKSEYARTI